MEEKNDVDEFMLPGFRFHPTDEELVEFYLKMKLQHRTLPVELIKQVDIYKYDPWDLPKLASAGEKEWYFYCPRDRKYRNSTRPNRVTGSGFWKATGTDRPIYSSTGPKCIGLKKSLVFYRGRAAKGIKTDWMMHEFRLPSAADGAAPPPPSPKKAFDKSLPPNDSWAICRIFKKANSAANRALSHTWAVAPLSETTSEEAFAYAHFSPESDFQQQHTDFSARTSAANVDFLPTNLVFSEEASAASSKSSMLYSHSPALHAEVAHHHFDGNGGGGGGILYSLDGSSQVIEGSRNGDRKSNVTVHSNVWESIRSMGFPFSLPSEEWESPPSYSTNKGYI